MRNISILSKKRQKNRRLRRASLRRRLRRAAGASSPDPVYTRAMPHDLSRSLRDEQRTCGGPGSELLSEGEACVWYVSSEV